MLQKRKWDKQNKTEESTRTKEYTVYSLDFEPIKKKQDNEIVLRVNTVIYIF